MHKNHVFTLQLSLLLIGAIALVGSRPIEAKGDNGASGTLMAGGVGRIAFVSNRTGNNDIHVMRPDGSDVLNLTNNPAGDDFPAWSPDGSRIAFRSNRDGNREIYVMNDDGNDVVRLTFDSAIDTTPSWTPDGMIVFSSNRSGRFELYEMNGNGSGLRHIDVELDGRLVSPHSVRSLGFIQI